MVPPGGTKARRRSILRIVTLNSVVTEPASAASQQKSGAETTSRTIS